MVAVGNSQLREVEGCADESKHARHFTLNSFKFGERLFKLPFTDTQMHVAVSLELCPEGESGVFSSVPRMNIPTLLPFLLIPPLPLLSTHFLCASVSKLLDDVPFKMSFFNASTCECFVRFVFVCV